jgi:hypothetical protein
VHSPPASQRYTIGFALGVDRKSRRALLQLHGDVHTSLRTPSRLQYRWVREG